MLCDFKIRDWNWKVVYESQFPCLRDTKWKWKNWVSDKGLLDAWMKYGKNKYSWDGKYKFFWSFSNSDRSYALRSNLNYIPEFGLKDKNWNAITTFWEYKLSLNRVKYRICSWEGTSSTEEVAEEPVCEVDFAVTDHYLVQKSPYWEIRSDTNLSSYKNIDGWALFDWNKQDKAADYSVPASLATSLDTFINKYYGNSVLVKNSSKCWWEIRKVKGKSIYFIGNKNSQGAEVELSDDEKASCISTNVQKPYTLIALSDKINIRIKWSLYSNAMIMTKGNIIFDAEGFTIDNNWAPTACNGNINKYWHAWQMVKWIFYAGKWFLSDGHKFNNQKSNKEWCNYGNLHIKWVAIGDLSNVVKNRRSELYTWFHDWCDTKTPSTDSKCNSRRDVVLNWASVLVEYNPDLWGNLPPGAEDFNKALEVYRK
jgi:hypothetical protein